MTTLKDKIRSYKGSSPFFMVILDCLLGIEPRRYQVFKLIDLVTIQGTVYGKGYFSLRKNPELKYYNICTEVQLIQSCLYLAENVGLTAEERSILLGRVASIREMPLSIINAMALTA